MKNSLKESILTFINEHRGKKINDFLPNENNISFFENNDLEKINDFCLEYSNLEGKKLRREEENDLKKKLLEKYLTYLADLDITKNAFYFTLSVRASDALNNLPSFFSELYLKNYFDDSCY